MAQHTSNLISTIRSGMISEFVHTNETDEQDVIYLYELFERYMYALLYSMSPSTEDLHPNLIDKIL